MRLIDVFILFTLAISSFGQIKFDVKVSDKHLKKVEKSKDASSKLKAYKSYYQKDSIKAAKMAWKEYKLANKDSLKTIGKWKEARAHQKEIFLGKWKQPKKYFIDQAGFKPPQDSLDWALQEFAKAGDFEHVQRYYEQVGQYDSAHLHHFDLDSMQIDSLDWLERYEMKKRLESYLPEELKLESDKKVENQLLYNELDGYGNIKKVDRSGVSDFFKNVNPDEFTKSQLTIKYAKEKYAQLPNLEKKEEGIKRNSLKGKPLKNRLFLTGNIAVQSTDPLVVDMNIQIGYQWNKKLSSGVGLLLREQLSNRDSTSLTGDAHGFSIFTNYDIMKGFFLYGEYQRVINKPLIGESSKPASWQYSLLLGAGRRFQLGKKVTLSVSLLYDLNYKNNTLNRRPLVPRVGYQVRF